MNKYYFATLRLGKTSVADIRRIDTTLYGVQKSPYLVDVVCTQVPTELSVGTYVFIWLGSDNSKGIATAWKQGFKAFGKINGLKKGANYNDESTTTVEVLYIFKDAVNRLDILREAPQSYYWCSSLPIIGLDDHSNQTIRMLDSSIDRGDIRAFFNVLEQTTSSFREDMVSIDKGLSALFDYKLLNPKIKESTANNDIRYKQTLNKPLQQIYYGAPGTGKSHATNEVTSKSPDTVRTTFHPDSDYSTFVGAYKPTMSAPQKRYELDGNHKVFAMKYPEGDSNEGFICETKIEYKFVKQAFLKAYVKAWKLFKESCADGQELKPQFLVIEEINRGNCAQIFGDLFQLLDRKQKFSEYPVEADADICKALLEEDTKDNSSFGAEGLQLTEDQKIYINSVYDGKPVAEKICKGEVLVLPPNLYIWATMNTSDQSLFPIDSAFKRRWEWKYMKIKQGYKTDEQGNPITDGEGKKVPLGWKIEIKGEDQQIKLTQDWWAFIQKVNSIIASMTSSADKQLGYFFCKADKYGVISGETFVSKVIFYLWNDVFKDYGFEDASLFRYKVKEEGKEVEKDLTFPDFYDEDGEKVDAERLVDFIQKVMAWQKPEENA